MTINIPAAADIVGESCYVCPECARQCWDGTDDAFVDDGACIWLVCIDCMVRWPIPVSSTGREWDDARSDPGYRAHRGVARRVLKSYSEAVSA